VRIGSVPHAVTTAVDPDQCQRTAAHL